VQGVAQCGQYMVRFALAGVDAAGNHEAVAEFLFNVKGA
jgi:hypothetical protein